MGAASSDEATRRVAWAIAEAWWRKSRRRAAGVTPEADSSEDYADRFWQGFTEEAQAALAAMAAFVASPGQGRHPVASDRFG